MSQFINAAYEWVLAAKIHLKNKMSTIRKCCLCLGTGGENTFKHKIQKVVSVNRFKKEKRQNIVSVSGC
jgi:hypothetical protein